jgi:hypothetical protein
MENNLKLSIGMTADTRDADQAIQRLKQQIKELQTSPNQLSQLSQQQQNQYSQAQEVAKKRAVQDLTKEYQTLSMIFDQNAQKLQGMNKNSDEALKIAKENINIAQEMNKIKEMGASIDGKQTEEIEKQNKSYKDLLGTLGKVVASAAVLKGALNFGQFLTNLPMQTEMSQGAIRQMAMEPLNLAKQNRLYEMMAFAPERNAAMQMSQEKRSNQETLDKLQGLLTLAGGVGAMATGGGLGIAAGSTLLSNLGGRSGLALGSGVGLGTNAYQSLLDKEQFQDYMALTKAKRYENLPKGLGSDFLNENLQGMLGVQRATGMSDERLFGERKKTPSSLVEGMGAPEEFMSLSEMEKATKYGDLGGEARFRASDAMRTLIELSKAGVTNQQISGDMAGMTMAAQQQGISGAVGIQSAFGRVNQAQTDENFIRLFAKGLDSSRTGEDLNKFMQVTAELATRTGFVSQEMEDRLLAGAKDSSMFALEMSKQAAMDFSQREGATTGLEAQVGMQFLTNKSNIAGVLGSDQKASDFMSALSSKENATLASELSALTTEELADDQLMESYSMRFGGKISADDIRKIAKATNVQKAGGLGTMNPAFTKAREEFKKTIRDRQSRIQELEAIPQRNQETEKELQDLKKSLFDVPTELVSTFKGMGKFYGGGGEEGLAFEKQLQMLDPEISKNMSSADIEKARRELEQNPNRMAEKVARGGALAEGAGFEGFQQYREQFEKSAEAMNQNSVGAAEAFKKVEEAAKDAGQGLRNFVTILNLITETYNKNVPVDQRIAPITTSAKSASAQSWMDNQAARNLQQITPFKR